MLKFVPYSGICIRLCSLQVAFAEQQIIKPRERESYSVPQDPLFPFQWSLVSILNINTP